MVLTKAKKIEETGDEKYSKQEKVLKKKYTNVKWICYLFYLKEDEEKKTWKLSIQNKKIFHVYIHGLRNLHHEIFSTIFLQLFDILTGLLYFKNI